MMAAEAILRLRAREEPLSSTLRMPVEQALHPANLDKVHPNSNNHVLWS
jgi:hypothetical protein